MSLLPTKAYRQTKARGLTGDVRPNLVSPFSVQLIDAEWEVPGAFMVTALSQGLAPTWTLRTGLDRSILVPAYTVTNDFFSVIVVARSIALSAVQSTQGGVGYVQAVAVPIDISFDATDFQNAQSISNGIGVVSPAVHSVAVVNGVPVNINDVVLTPGGNAGVAIVNYSPAGRNLYVRLGSDAASIWTGGYTFGPILPNGYYETPFGFSGPVHGIWDGADGLGFANVTQVV